MNRFILLSTPFVVLSGSYSYGMEEEEFPSLNTPIEQFKKSEVRELNPALFVLYRISTDMTENTDESIGDSLKIVYGRKNCTSYEYIHRNIDRLLAKKNDDGFIQYGQWFSLTNFDDGRYITYLVNQAKSKENKEYKEFSLIVFYNKYVEPLKVFDFNSTILKAKYFKKGYGDEVVKFLQAHDFDSTWYEARYFKKFVTAKLVIKRIESKGGEWRSGVLFGGKEGKKRIARYYNKVGRRSDRFERNMTIGEIIEQHSLEKRFDLSELEQKGKKRD